MTGGYFTFLLTPKLSRAFIVVVTPRPTASGVTLTTSNKTVIAKSASAVTKKTAAEAYLPSFNKSCISGDIFVKNALEMPKNLSSGDLVSLMASVNLLTSPGERQTFQADGFGAITPLGDGKVKSCFKKLSLSSGWS